jgi:ribonuclease HI
MERLVLWNLEDTTLKLKPIHRNQHAFRRGHSTEIPLSKLTNFVEQAFINKEYAVCIFLDIIGAFNNVTHQAIIKAMNTANFPKEIIMWYGNYTQCRSCEITIGSKTFKCFLKDGTSQGGILSPIIFNLVINILLLIIEKAKILGIAFADEAMKGASGRCLQTILARLQKTLNDLTKALDETGMKFSPGKTAVIIFSKKNVETQNLPRLTMYNEPLEYQEQTKYLGVTFDSKLTFKPHIANKFKSAKKLLFATKNMMGKFWGPKPSMTKWLYTNIVRPTFTYGCIAWAKNTRSKDFISKAKRLQRLALKDIGPIRTHSPTSGIEIFTNTIPLDLYIRGEFMSAHARVRNIISTFAGTTDTISSHYAWALKLKDEAGIHNIPTDITTPFFHGHKKYQCFNTQYNALNEFRPDKLQIYTDGSKISKNATTYTGCGFVIYGKSDDNEPKIIHSQSSYLGTMTTVFQAEVFAIGQATHFVTQNPTITTNINQIDIITDSKAALQAIDGLVTSSKLVKDCMNALDKLQNKTKISIHWTKAHVGHEGNEKADQLAKEGTTKGSYATEPILPVPKAWVNNKIKAYLKKEWTNRWKGTAEARQTKIFFTEPNMKLTQKLLNYDKSTCAKLFRWVSGHSFHRYHNNLLHPEKFTNPQCRACDNAKEETSHLFAYCPGLAPIRSRILGVPTLNENFEWKPQQLLAMIKEIDKICPEEGSFDEMPNDTNSQASDMNINNTSE